MKEIFPGILGYRVFYFHCKIFVKHKWLTNLNHYLNNNPKIISNGVKIITPIVMKNSEKILD
jgi:hypothetical protein